MLLFTVIYPVGHVAVFAISVTILAGAAFAGGGAGTVAAVAILFFGVGSISFADAGVGAVAIGLPLSPAMVDGGDIVGATLYANTVLGAGGKAAAVEFILVPTTACRTFAPVLCIADFRPIGHGVLAIGIIEFLCATINTIAIAEAIFDVVACEHIGVFAIADGAVAEVLFSVVGLPA